MAVRSTDVACLTSEYQTLLHEARWGQGATASDWIRLERGLIRDGDWTPRGAAHLIDVVQRYGSFFLRNAAALALAAGIEDGVEGL
jgi:hypothetical protein